MLEASQVSKLKSQLGRVAGYCSLWRPRRPVWSASAIKCW